MAFETTRWSVIAAARADDTAAARAALSTLCETYWYPLYAYVRRRGLTPDDARDLTQSFLASLLERRDLERVQPERGRFRSFLLASLKHFLANDTARRLTQKRGGAVVIVPLELDAAEGRYSAEPADPSTPETLYERRWALTVVEHVIAAVQGKWQEAGRGAEFDVLKASLLGEGPPGGYAAAARTLGTTEGAVKVAVHRLRRAFRTELRAAIAETVVEPSEVDDELKYLERALRL